MNLLESAEPFFVKDEYICKNECEVIIDVDEDCGNFDINSVNYPAYYDNEVSYHSAIETNIKNNGCKKQRSKSQMRFGCILCDYKTANSTNFKIHLRTHTGEKPYKCELCPYRAKVLCALYRHRRVHTGERPYACNECPYRAAQPSHLVRHKMVHTGERPHSCNLCNYSASQMSHLVRHMSVHTNYRPFPCNECPYRAKRKSHLQKHLGTHDKERKLNAMCTRQLRNINRNFIRFSDLDNEQTVNNSPEVCRFCNDNNFRSDECIMDKEELLRSPDNSVNLNDAETQQQVECDFGEEEDTIVISSPATFEIEKVDPLAEDDTK